MERGERIFYYFYLNPSRELVLQVQKIIEFYRETFNIVLVTMSYINWYSENKIELFLVNNKFFRHFRCY